MNHVVTPLKRYQNLQTLVEFWRPKNIVWHLVVDDAPFRISFNRDSDWIYTHIYRGTDPAGADPCLTRLNWFLENVPTQPYDKYCFFNDDDACEPDFFTKIKDSATHVTICSLQRGHNIPNPAMPHGTDTLVAAPDNMKPCHCSLEQLIVTGKMASEMRFPIEGCGDGMLIQKLCAERTVTYLPETFAWFNYFEPGRWNKS